MALKLMSDSSAPKEDRVRAQTCEALNRKLDIEMERRLRFYSYQDEQAISERIAELDREWDIERVLETNAASLALLGMLLGATRSRRWFLLPFIVSGFLLQHAIQGWCPPVPILRRLGVRTRLEIEQERYALKLLRGDFEGVERQEATGAPNTAHLTEALRS
ncbi:MAG TPA: hypothetical protein VG146_07480 [Verrucomicrobiae bacterium]|nr:hypothetical protein [Verrucomicrobiae bacterium]